MRIIGVIPARYKSSRFPGKPLADIMGKPMIWWTYKKAFGIAGVEDVYVATDSEIIFQTCNGLGMKVLMTSESCPSGVDRLAEVAVKIEADYYLLIQGDEPLIEPKTIKHMVDSILESPKEESVRTFKTKIKNPVDIVNHTIIKIVTDLQDFVLMASRSPIPYPKGNLDFEYFKSVGVYAYPRNVLLKYPNLTKGYLECAEDHDFMRMLENGIKIKAYTYATDTISVDTPKDLERVKKIMEQSNGS